MDGGMDASTPERDAAADAAPPDMPDAAPDTAVMVPEPLRYERLSDTGLYSDIAAGTLGDGVREYEPFGKLWTDGAGKRRWVKLPDGEQIDTTDMDEWSYPVGTKLFKEFTRDGVRVETRILEKLAEGDWFMVAFQWNDEQTDAVAVPDGVEDASGTEHDIPDQGDCTWCHDGRADKALGFTAIQLSHDAEGMTLTKLIDEGLLTDPPAGNFTFPGDEAEQSALRYLHANCGHCHNETRTFARQPGMENRGVTTLFFWQEVERLATVEDTVTYYSVIETRASNLPLIGITNRVEIGNMPATGTEIVDPDGLARLQSLVDAWQGYFADEDAGVE